MKGTILDFSMQTSIGLITGDDGKRYSFPSSEWKESALPTRGTIVDFDIQDGKAAAIYIVSATPAQPPPLVRIARPKEYEGWYKSSDDKVLTGVCGGLAHRWNMNSNVLRVLVLILGIFFLVPVIIYLILEIGLKKKLPTKGKEMA